MTDTTPRAAETGGKTMWTVRDTPIGPLLIAANEQGLVQITMRAGERTVRRSLARLDGRLVAAPGSEAHRPPLGPVVAEVDAYFRGDLRTFTVPLDWRLTSGFHRRVLKELAAVPYGTVVGYQDLADRTGEPGAARAVGAAMGANPLPLVVPCHRVVASDGGIGGFGAGLEIKRALLALEGVLPAPLF